MALQYTSDTDSVRYLTNFEGNSAQGTRNYGTSTRYHRLLNSSRRCLRNISWERVLILLAVKISIVSFVFSAINYIETGRLIEEISKKSVNPNATPHAGNAILPANGSAAPFQDMHPGSGEDENKAAEFRWSQLSVMELIKEDSQRTGKRTMQTFRNELANFTASYENEVGNIVKELDFLQQFRRLTKTEIVSLKATLDEIRRMQNGTWKYKNHLGESEETSLDEVMKILFHVTEQVESSTERLASLNVTSSKFISRDQLRFFVDQLDSIQAINATMNGLEVRLNDQFRTDMIQQRNNSRYFDLISNSIIKSNNSFHRLRNTAARLATITEENRQNIIGARSIANNGIQRIKNTLDQRLNAVSRQFSSKIFQMEARLNAALQKVQRDVAQSARRLTAATGAMNKLKAYESFMTRVNSSLASLTKALNGKADKDWTPAPNRYEYQLTLQLFSSWVDAKAKCQQLGASLACVGPRNSNMQKYLFANLVQPRGESAWIGLSDRAREGTWKWIDGVTLDNAKWSQGQPNNVLRGAADQDCAEIYEKDGLWNDRWCVRTDGRGNPALCERRM